MAGAEPAAATGAGVEWRSQVFTSSSSLATVEPNTERMLSTLEAPVFVRTEAVVSPCFLSVNATPALWIAYLVAPTRLGAQAWYGCACALGGRDWDPTKGVPRAGLQLSGPRRTETRPRAPEQTRPKGCSALCADWGRCRTGPRPAPPGRCGGAEIESQAAAPSRITSARARASGPAESRRMTTDRDLGSLVAGANLRLGWLPLL